MIVEHVTVNEGGKAIVGNVTHGGAGGIRKTGADLMNAVYPFQNSPRCSATSKRTRKPCQAPAVTGWTVCRFHGARGGGPKGKRNGRYRHGRFSKATIAEQRMVRDFLKQCARTWCELAVSFAEFFVCRNKAGLESNRRSPQNAQKSRSDRVYQSLKCRKQIQWGLEKSARRV